MVEEADAEGAEYAIMDRVNDAVEELLSAHPARHDEIIATLRDRDAKVRLALLPCARNSASLT